MIETLSERVKRLYEGHISRGRDPRNAAQRIVLSLRTKTYRPKIAEVEALLKEAGIVLPERQDGHLNIDDPSERAKVIYGRRIEKGMAPGYALGYTARAMRLPAQKVRELLAAVGIFPEPGLLGFANPNAKNARTKGKWTPRKRLPQAPKPKPIVSTPKKVLIVAPYRDDAPCVVLSPQEILNELRAKGEKSLGFVPVKEIFAPTHQEESRQGVLF